MHGRAKVLAINFYLSLRNLMHYSMLLMLLVELILLEKFLKLEQVILFLILQISKRN